MVGTLRAKQPAKHPSQQSVRFRISARATSRGRPAKNCWIEADLSGGWRVAYRLAAQNGRPIVSEVRVYPAEGGAQAGGWSGEELGMEATTVPSGGLTATLLREVRLGAHLLEGKRALEWAKTKTRARDRDVSLVTVWLRRLGLKSLRPPEKKPGPGRLGRPHHEVAQVARDYARAVSRDSRHPIQDVHATHDHLSLDQLRDVVRRARQLRYLTPSAGRGRMGGVLTKAGRDALRFKQTRGGTKRRSKRFGRPEIISRGRIARHGEWFVHRVPH